MSLQAIFVLCAQAVLIQFSQCACGGNYGAGRVGYGWGAPASAVPTAALAGRGLACGAGLGYSAGLGNGVGLNYGAGSGYGAGLGYGGLAIEVIPTSGGGLPVTSTSAIAPSGLSIASENVFEGALSMAGELPFVNAVALDAVLPSSGAGVVNYRCGNGITAIESFAPSAAAYAPAAVGIAPAAAAITPGLGYGGLAGHGCGCGFTD